MAAMITIQPILPLGLIAALAALSLGLVAVALWRGLTGWWLRGLAALVLLAALANPALRQEDRVPLSDIAIVVVDETPSNRIGARAEQTEAALEAVRARLARLDTEAEPLETRVVRVPDAGEDGTRLLRALAEAAAEIAPDRLAGAILITDGQVHDADRSMRFPAPVHALITGTAEEWDRRIVVERAPAYAIVDEPVTVTIRVEDLGRPPEGTPNMADVTLAWNGEAPQTITVPVGRSVDMDVTLDRGGQNVLELATPVLEGELTGRNNAAVIEMNGIRDRLRVLLVSGEPYAGERTWRNILKSDSSVDLVHFTILRPPDKQDYVPVFELSLIAFPTQELFMEKVDEFDLIIFDRYRRRGILPNHYIENITRYVRDGGALLVASGDDLAGAESLYRSPLRSVLPGSPTGRLIEEGFHPRIAAIGRRHPVTETLEAMAPRPAEDDGTPGWGRWFRMVELEPTAGHVVMEGPGERPLLLLDRYGAGRVALLGSDQAWLWQRGFEGGGPHQELLRRLAHWLMAEPELEEEALTATVANGAVTVTRRTLADDVPPVTATGPDGAIREIALTEVAPGRWQGRFETADQGVWRLESGDVEGVAVVGQATPREFENPVSTTELLGPIADATGGAVRRLAEDVPDIRRVAEGRLAEGRGWIGLYDRDAHALRDIRQTSLAPGWLMLLLSALLATAAWRIEGR